MSKDKSQKDIQFEIAKTRARLPGKNAANTVQASSVISAQTARTHDIC